MGRNGKYNFTVEKRNKHDLSEGIKLLSSVGDNINSIYFSYDMMKMTLYPCGLLPENP